MRCDRSIHSPTALKERALVRSAARLGHFLPLCIRAPKWSNRALSLTALRRSYATLLEVLAGLLRGDRSEITTWDSLDHTDCLPDKAWRNLLALQKLGTQKKWIIKRLLLVSDSRRQGCRDPWPPLPWTRDICILLAISNAWALVES